jgi:hypothetical protein
LNVPASSIQVDRCFDLARLHCAHRADTRKTQPTPA